MIPFVIRRLLVSIPVLLGSTVLVFVMVKVSGDPLEYLKLRSPRPPQHTIDLESQRLRLDEPVVVQYWDWLKGLLLHGDFGPSIHTNRDIGHEIFKALAVTARLVIVSVLVALVLAVVTGVVSAVKQYSITDYTTTFFGLLFLSMPIFWFAALLKAAGIWYNQHVSAGFFGTIGEKSVYLEDNSFSSRMLDYAGHTALPVIALGLVGYASWSRFQRASMLEVLNSDYVRLARSKGISRSRVLVRHGLRTALIPLTTVVALDVAALLGGAIVTETVFQWHGMGDLFLQAVRELDAYLMMGWLLVSATIVILFNLIADILYGVLDPRIRHA